MNWKAHPYLVVDTETTGVHYSDRVVELAMVLMLKGEVVREEVNLVDPGRPIPAGASAIHGITDEMVRGKPTLASLSAHIRTTMLIARTVVAYNWPFDRQKLASEVVGWDEFDPMLCVLDPLPIVRQPYLSDLFKGRSRKLGDVFRELVGPIDGKAHSATYDCVMAGKVLWAIRDYLPDLAVDAAKVVEIIGNGEEV